MTDEPVLAIGVDGGASGVRALAVRRRADGYLEAAGEVARYEHDPFTALDFGSQCAEADDPRRGEAEIASARARVRATADVVEDAADGHRRIRLGICWPGQKTADGRGISVARNGPRIPAFLEDLAPELARRGIELAAPIPRLASDGVTGALGERWASEGILRDVRDALYFAGGSGLAEALLVAGRVRALDEVEPPLPKAFVLRIAAWQLRLKELDRRLTVYEDVLSPGRWSIASPELPPSLGLRVGLGRVDWSEYVRREPRRAEGTLRVAADALVRYIEDRMRRLRDHGFGTPECAVVGARLGALIALPAARAMLHEPIVEHLRAAGLPPDFVRASTLLEAPCYGAAALALGLENEACPS
jgi:hypothetical protein